MNYVVKYVVTQKQCADSAFVNYVMQILFDMSALINIKELPSFSYDPLCCLFLR